MNYKVGQKVVCIKSGTWATYTAHGIACPQKDEVCTITGITVDNAGYISTNFRPVDELSNVGINDLIEILPFIERREKINI